MDTAIIHNRIRTLTTDVKAATAAAALNKLQRLKELVREIERDMTARLIEWIQANGDLEIGELRYYVGTEKKTRCNDVRGTLAALLELFAGDLDRVAECLGSSAWKHGAIKKALEEIGQAAKFPELFTVTEETDLKTGQPAKKLMTVNPKFTR